MEITDLRASNRAVIWKCACDCGDFIYVSSGDLLRERKRDCGCIKRKKLLGKTFGMLTVESITDKRDSSGNILWDCRCQCGNHKLARTSRLVRGEVASCGCMSTSSGEYFIEQVLSKYGITYETQKCFSDCFYKATLSFDFYLPAYNILVEYDGEQHFNPIPAWGGKERFKIQQKRDAIKNQYCQDNGIMLLRLPYTLAEEEIETKILGTIYFPPLLAGNTVEAPALAGAFHV